MRTNWVKLGVAGLLLLATTGVRAQTSVSAAAASWIEDVQLSKVAATYAPDKVTDLEMYVTSGFLECRHRLGTNPWTSTKVTLATAQKTVAANQIPDSARFQVKVNFIKINPVSSYPPGTFKVTRPRDELTRANYRQVEWVLRTCMREITK